MIPDDFLAWRRIGRVRQLLSCAKSAEFDHSQLPFAECQGNACYVCRIENLRLAMNALDEPLGASKVEAWTRAMEAQDRSLPAIEISASNPDFDWERPLRTAANAFVIGRGGGTIPTHKLLATSCNEEDCLACAIEALRQELIVQRHEWDRKIQKDLDSAETNQRRQRYAEADGFFRWATKQPPRWRS